MKSNQLIQSIDDSSPELLVASAVAPRGTTVNAPINANVLSNPLNDDFEDNDLV